MGEWEYSFLTKELVILHISLRVRHWSCVGVCVCACTLYVILRVLTMQGQHMRLIDHLSASNVW